MFGSSMRSAPPSSTGALGSDTSMTVILFTVGNWVRRCAATTWSPQTAAKRRVAALRFHGESDGASQHPFDHRFRPLVEGTVDVATEAQ